MNGPGDRHFQAAERKHFLALFILLFLFWVLLSGKMEVIYLSVGLATAFSVALLTKNLLRLPARNGSGYYPAFDLPYGRYLLYWLWLLKEIVKANVEIALVVLSPRLAIDPQIVTFRKYLPNPLAQVTLANSITLTPGTVVVDVQDHVYMVHALTRSAAASLVPETGQGEMQAKVDWLFGREEEAAGEADKRSDK